MPRHPPIALKTLDRSHCQCPSARSRRDRRFSQTLTGLASARSQRDRRYVTTLRVARDVIGTKRPASRDRFEGAVRQTHHMQGIERPRRQIMNLADHEVRTNLLFTMSNRTSGKPRSSPQTFFTNDFFSPSQLNTILAQKARRSCGSRGRQTATWRMKRRSLRDRASGGAGRDRTDDILLAKQALSQLSYGP